MKKILSLLTSIFFSAFLVLSLLPNAFAANTSMHLSTNHVRFNNRSAFDTEIVMVSLTGEAADADVSLTYEIFPVNQNVVSAFWASEWQDNSLPLILTPEGNGTVTIRITNDFNDDQQLLKVSVTNFGVPAAAAPQTCTAKPTHNPIYVKNKLINTIPVYNINNSNYFKLRDISYLMDFGVNWNEDKRCVEIDTTHSSDGAQISIQAASQTKTATLSTQPIYIDGTLYDDMTVYHIDGNNYFKLRDLAQNVDFGCAYDTALKTIKLDNDYHYDSNNVFGSSKNTSTYSYYTEYPSVPDFGSVTGALLYRVSEDNVTDIMYFYDPNFASGGINKYQQLLVQNGFPHLTDYTEPSSGEAVSVYKGRGLVVMLGYIDDLYTVYVLEDEDSNTSSDNTSGNTSASYKSYADYSFVPDFGAYTNTNLYSTEKRDGQGVIYTYYNTFSSSQLDSYKQLLLSNGFTYLGYNSSIQAYVYSGHNVNVLMNYVPNTNNKYFMFGIMELG